VKLVPVIVTELPTEPLAGENDVTVGAATTVKLDPLVPVPPGVVTAIAPVVAPAGTVVVIEVAETTVNDAALTPLNITAVAPVKLVPVIVTEAPTAPLVGENDATVGATVTVKLDALVPVPPGPVTVTVPVVAVAGTVAVICVPETIENVAVFVLNFTAVTPVKLRPVSVTEVPTGPLAGANEPIDGATLNVAALAAVPPGVVTEIVPLVAPTGTLVVICVSEVTVKPNTLVPLNPTAVAPVKPVPVIVTDTPTAPLFGANELTVGGAKTAKAAVLPAVPAGVVMLIDPVVAPVGTVAVT
jgi:hypothetical protein